MKESQLLLSEKESKEVIGTHFGNYWILSIVLLLTFLSIAFSNASMEYLEVKMNDPFTNWINIENKFSGEKFQKLRKDLDQSEELQNQYLFSSVQGDTYRVLSLVNKDKSSSRIFEGRFCESLDSRLIEKVLSPENVVEGCSVKMTDLSNCNIGLIITEEVLHKLGYSSSDIPPYICISSSSPGADTLGFSYINEQYCAVPIPLLGVVKRLPMNSEFMSSIEFYKQIEDRVHNAFNISNQGYVRNLYYFSTSQIQNKKESISEIIPPSMDAYVSVITTPIFLNWQGSDLISVSFSNADISLDSVRMIDKRILQDTSLVRFYYYDLANLSRGKTPCNYLSIDFYSLDSIRSFEKFVKDAYNVKIEMSQVEAKENFNNISILSKILSTIMFLFSLSCIVLFIINLLNNYFQKVKKNLGTFKAFGMSTSELILVYLFIMLKFILKSIILAVIAAVIIQLSLNLCGIQRSGGYDYLSLFCWQFFGSVVVILAATIFSVYFKMNELLKKTPGDLIYDR